MIHDIGFIKTYFVITVIAFALLTYFAVRQRRAKLLILVIFPFYALNLGIVHDLKESRLLLSVLFPLIVYAIGAALYYFTKD